MLTDYCELLINGLEAARDTLNERAQTLGIPPSVVLDWPTVKQEGMSTNLRYTKRQVSSLNDPIFYTQLMDPPSEETPVFGFGFKNEFDSLSQLLVDETDLGSRPGPAALMRTTPEIVREYYLVPLALHYVKSLSSLDMPDQLVLKRLCLEFDGLLSSREVTRVMRLLVHGISPAEPEKLIEYDTVELRKLSADETSLIWQLSDSLSTSRPYLDSNLIPPGPRFWSLPSSVLSVRHSCSDYPCSHHEDIRKQMYQIALAFFLRGYRISGYGHVTLRELPYWSLSGSVLSPFPLHEKHLPIQSISQDEFASIVEFANKTPVFDRVQSSSREVALYRGLCALGADWKESTLLDFAICLEATLLRDVSNELSYRFALYGALFLADREDAQVTFKRLRNIYSVRSKLVHGSKINDADLKTAERDAAELTQKILHKSIEVGWPDKDDLDNKACSFNSLN